MLIVQINNSHTYIKYNLTLTIIHIISINGQNYLNWTGQGTNTWVEFSRYYSNLLMEINDFVNIAGSIPIKKKRNVWNTFEVCTQSSLIDLRSSDRNRTIFDWNVTTILVNFILAKCNPWCMEWSAISPRHTKLNVREFNTLYHITLFNIKSESTDLVSPANVFLPSHYFSLNILLPHWFTISLHW